jgi:hypothetical protein
MRLMARVLVTLGVLLAARAKIGMCQAAPGQAAPGQAAAAGAPSLSAAQDGTTVRGTTVVRLDEYATDSAALAVAAADTVVTFRQLDGLRGLTFCFEGAAVSFVREEQPALARRDSEAHEAEHRRQFRAARSCEVANWAAHTPRGRLEAEAAAYMAGLCAVALANDSLPDSLRVDVFKVRTQYERLAARSAGLYGTPEGAILVHRAFAAHRCEARP